MITKAGSFFKSTNISVPVNQSISGVGFRPKVIFMHGALNTAAGNAAPQALGFGVAVGTGVNDQIGSMLWGQDAVSSTAANRGTNQSLLCWVDNFTQSTANRVADCSLASFDDNGFTVTWTINNATAYLVQYFCLGGDELQASLSHMAIPTGTGNKAYTGVGFKPDFIMTIPSGHSAWPSQGLSGNFGYGAAISPTNRWAWCMITAPSVTMSGTASGGKYQRTDCCALLLATSSTEAIRFDLVSMDSDGYTVNQITNNGSIPTMFTLAMRGGWYDMGAFAKATTAAPVTNSIVTSKGKPAGILTASINAVAGTTILGDGYHSLGNGDGTNENALACYWKNAVIPSVCKSYVSTTKSIANITGTTLNSEADWVFTSTGFNVNWTTNDAVAAQILWTAFGTNPLEEETAPPLLPWPAQAAPSATLFDEEALPSGALAPAALEEEGLTWTIRTDWLYTLRAIVDGKCEFPFHNCENDFHRARNVNRSSRYKEKLNGTTYWRGNHRQRRWHAQRPARAVRLHHRRANAVHADQ